MKKGLGIVVFLSVLLLVILSLSVELFAPPAPPTLIQETGRVRKDYVDQGKVRKTYYTMEKPDGTQSEFYSEEPVFKEKIEKAALANKEVTVWHGEGDGEIYAMSVDYNPVH